MSHGDRAGRGRGSNTPSVTHPADSAEPPATPAAARSVFGTGLGLAERYARWLSGPGVERGLIGPREVPRLWERHLLNCGVVHELIPHGTLVWDVGSGAGLPGIALAIARPDLRVTLLEPLLRRTRFLAECVADLGLDNATIRRERAERVPERGVVDVVTARAVAPLERLAVCALPLLRPMGELLALKGESAWEELRAAEGELQELGAAEWSVVSVGAGVVETPATVVRVRRGGARMPCSLDRGAASNPRPAKRHNRGRRER
ncbi:MAG: 16S rRNA (guanine(527)-N(7))-methyltransferase RsmG [Streptomycetales bacterium]